ncbi:UNVERIFIED_CONTAM: hypothetical protein FKN15_005041 [Acipenser sinensis]
MADLIHTSLINGRPSADDPSPVLLNFTSARYIRFQFRRIRTLNADLMTLAYNDPRDVDPIVTRRVTSYEPDPCVPCSCDPDGSLHDTCIKDETKVEGDLGPGSCHCKLGYGGQKCDRCAFGYTGFPHCIRCNCSLDGSQNTDPCEKPCNCKENVEGENCDRCKVGFYNLQNGNPKGCEKCYCSGVSSECTESHWTYSNVSDMSGWFLTGPLGIKKAHPVQDSYDGPQQLSISNEEARKVLPPLYYWSAQPAYLGNKIGTEDYSQITEKNVSCMGFTKKAKGRGTTVDKRKKEKEDSCPEANWDTDTGLEWEEPERPTPRRGEPEHPAPRRREPKHPAPRRREPKHPAPRRREPKHPVQRRKEPKHPAPRRREPKHPAPRGGRPSIHSQGGGGALSVHSPRRGSLHVQSPRKGSPSPEPKKGKPKSPVTEGEPHQSPATEGKSHQSPETEGDYLLLPPPPPEEDYPLLPTPPPEELELPPKGPHLPLPPEGPLLPCPALPRAAKPAPPRAAKPALPGDATSPSPRECQFSIARGGQLVIAMGGQFAITRGGLHVTARECLLVIAAAVSLPEIL